MTVINTGLLEKGLNSAFFARYDATQTHFGDLATRIDSKSDSEKYKWLGSTPRMREWGTGRIAKGVRTESYSVENEKYESTVEVDKDELADDQTGQITIRVQELAARAATHKDFLISQLLKNGETAGFNAFDGKPFFAADHESGASGAQTNKLTFTAADANKPTTLEFKQAFEQAVSKMLGYLDDVGEPANIDTNGLFCLVPTSMLFPASEALNATIINNTSNVLTGLARPIVFPWLTDRSKWYLLKTSGVVRPFIFQDREPVTFDSLTEGSDIAFRKEIFEFGARARYAITYGLWNAAVRTQFTV